MRYSSVVWWEFRASVGAASVGVASVGVASVGVASVVVASVGVTNLSEPVLDRVGLTCLKAGSLLFFI